VREYLYIDQLADLTPWSPQAIRTMIARGIFKENVHYFRPKGAASRPIFSWTAVVNYIEGQEAKPAWDGAVPLAGGGAIDLDEAAKEVHRLLR
jgi:hypothetical protein